MAHTRRTTLVLNEELLGEARRLSGQPTFSKTVDLALTELVRRARAGKILELAGQGLWEGDLATMRRDAPATQKRRKSRAAA